MKQRQQRSAKEKQKQKKESRLTKSRVALRHGCSPSLTRIRTTTKKKKNEAGCFFFFLLLFFFFSTRPMRNHYSQFAPCMRLQVSLHIALLVSPSQHKKTLIKATDLFWKGKKKNLRAKPGKTIIIITIAMINTEQKQIYLIKSQSPVDTAKKATRGKEKERWPSLPE